MAAEPWNRVNIVHPGAVSSVPVRFSSTTDTFVKNLLLENEKVLKLLRSPIFQTEVRVLYELLYTLNNSYRGNKTFKALKQVEQCINRLKCMKLDDALQELTELCPNRIQRGLSIKAGECDVPSQPMLEWTCLKVLGAAQLMNCTLQRCSRAFSLTKQQMKWEEFATLNMVITSMLSRFWVIARGILVSLSTLYQQLLQLLKEVAKAQPMPFLKDFSLPVDMAQHLGRPDVLLLTKKKGHGPRAEDQNKQQLQQMGSKTSLKGNQGGTRKVKEDLGVAIERDVGLVADMKPFLKVFKDYSEKTHKVDHKRRFRKRMREATTFTDMETHLKEIIPWCRSQKMEKEKRLLTFLHLKCQRMKCLEAAGYNVQRKLRTFRQEAYWASCPRSVSRTRRPSAAVRTCARLKTHRQSLKSRIKSSVVRSGMKKKPLKRQRKSNELSQQLGDRQIKRTRCETKAETTSCDSNDDIDDIFASFGL